ncbi:lasso peptide biosynthesis PqqD family chaperone [Marinicrinis lubricantis]|uniref:Lasso peptide biosynthesis PqqD family chaperone n=1 Tax=Marinicrinis lubricantis TaxID=2086470 RepID=A0ABW1IJU4_9BACL
MTHKTIGLEAIVVQAEGQLVSDMDGDKVMMSIRSGKYYNLGPVGGRIWELIASPTPVTRLVESLLAEYDIEQSVCEAEVLSFLQLLANEQLIEMESQLNSV